MQSAKEHLLYLMLDDDTDCPDVNILLTHDVAFQRKGETKPFGELVTEKDGSTVLRIGAVYQDGIKVIV